MSQIPTVVNGVTTIDATTFGVPVANQLNQKHEHLALAPGANTDATTTAVMTLWLTLGNLTVPSWAVAAIISVSINEVSMITAAGPYDLQAKIGTDTGRTVGCNASGQLLGINTNWHDKITLTSTGPKALTIWASRPSGTGTLRALTTSDITANVTYIG